MGTRAAFGFRVDGVDKVTYQHCDGYPEYLGIRVLKSLHGKSLDELRAVAGAVEMVTVRSTPTEEQIEKCYQWADISVPERSMKDWYCLLHKAQGNLDAWIDGGLRYMIDNGKFLHDSLFCEYAYVVNLDDGVFEVYKGFNKNPQAPGRYAALKPRHDREHGYFGVALHKRIPLDTCFAFDADQAEAEMESWFPEDEEAA